MANTVNVTIMEKGPRNLFLHVYLQSDGVSGDLNKYVLIDPVADLGFNITARFELRRIDYNYSGFDSVIEFDSGGVTPTFKWVLTEGANAPVDFDFCGGVRDTSGLDGTGKLMLTTTGFNNSADSGSMIIKLRMPT